MIGRLRTEDGDSKFGGYNIIPHSFGHKHCQNSQIWKTFLVLRIVNGPEVLLFNNKDFDLKTSQLIRFARVSSHADDFNTRNKVLTAKLLRKEYRYHKFRKAFSKFYRQHFGLVSKYNV